MYPLNNTFPHSAPKPFCKLWISYHQDEAPFSALDSLWHVSWNVSIFNRGDNLYKAFSVLRGLGTDLVPLALKGADSQLTKHPFENSKYLQMTHFSPQPPPQQWWKRRLPSHQPFPMPLYIKPGQMGSLVFDLLYFFILVWNYPTFLTFP